MIGENNRVVKCLPAISLFLLGGWLVEGLEHPERHPNDGWFNNLQHPDWGAIDSILLRMSKAAYSDGSYEPSGESRPNPLDISNVAFKGSDNLESLVDRTALLVYFGQQLVEEIVDAQRPGCPREYHNIKVPKDHPYNPHGYDDLTMPFLRSRYDQRTGHSPNNPRQQLNEITPYIDGNLFYGAGKAWEDALRSFKDGLLLATSDDVTEAFPVENDIRLPYANPPIPRDHTLRPVSRFRRYGNPRAHENPFLNALGLVWFRYHNYIAATIKVRQPTWNDEQLFNAARKRVIAQYQKIVMYEWLPAWLQVTKTGKIVELRKKFPYHGGRLAKYTGYEPTLHPGITVEFQAAAMRFGHTLVPSRVVTQTIRHNACKLTNRNIPSRYTNNSDGNETESTVEGIRLCNSFWVSEESLEGSPGVSSVVLGMMYTRAAREDHVIVSDIRENTFGPLEWSRRDLGALNIQRGRDHGLPGYNDVRKAYGLPRKERWEDISGRPEVQAVLANLSTLHGFHDIASPDDLDVFAGGLLETVPEGPGELFFRIILDQFLRIRHGDRFWYENRDNGLFSDNEIDEIEATNFFDVLQSVMDIPLGDRRENVFICTPSVKFTNCHCRNPVAESPGVHETCEPLRHYDYFDGSGDFFVAVGVCLPLCIIITSACMYFLARGRQTEMAKKLADIRHKSVALPKDNQFYATEWVGRSSCDDLITRDIRIDMDSQRHKIFVSNYSGQVIRMIDVRKRAKWTDGQSKVFIRSSCDRKYRLLSVSVPGEIDLILHFPTQHQRDGAEAKLQNFFESHFWEVQKGQPEVEQKMWKEATTVDKRKEILAKFFRGILKKLSEGDKSEESDEDRGVEEDVLETKLTRTEFADAVGLQPQSLFVRNMFVLADTDGEGFISFDEFKNYFGILCSGSPDEKADMFFRMFDTSRAGHLTKENYTKMLKSLSEMNDPKGAHDLDKTVDTIFEKAGLKEQGYMTRADFHKVFFTDGSDIWRTVCFNMEQVKDYDKTISRIAVSYHWMKNVKFFNIMDGQSMPSVPMSPNPKSRPPVLQRTVSVFNDYRKMSLAKPLNSITDLSDTVKLKAKPVRLTGGWIGIKYFQLEKYTENHWRQIFWLSLYVTVTIGIFVERFYYFSFQREHAGLRRIAGYGVSVTRGAASAQMFTFASLLVTMCRNILSYLRETFLHRFIPFDNAYDMHKCIGWMAIFFTVMHVIGHLINFYQFSTQPSTDMNCYFREFFRSSDTLASFQYWLFETMTGITGVVLCILLVVMVVFSLSHARRNIFKSFYYTHKLSYVVYTVMFLHGGGRLVQEPFWAYFFLGPMVLYVLDTMVSVSRKKVLIPVHQAIILPSEVINLVFQRPLSFNYQSGQYVRIACPDLGHEYHPFTLTSAPHEDDLSLHIRAVGPWTSNLRSLFKHMSSRAVKLYIDGPFGESHQDWYRFPVSVLIGGGIGITPFASILKDIAHNFKDASSERIPCKKVYFLWVTRTQRSYEWMTDILQQVEAAGISDFVEINIYITQMKDRFDLRTAMLYVCERHFQKIAGTSMFTGLRARTHFGRPDFRQFFNLLRNEHTRDQIGVFSCGPPSMTGKVKSVCTEANSHEGPSFIHHYENF